MTGRRTLTLMVGCLLIVTGFNSCAIAFGGPEAKITAQVVDENGAPISNQEIRVGFEGAQGKGKVFNGVTDVNGRYTASHETLRSMSFTVNREGYYRTYSEYEFVKMEPQRFLPKTYKWLPWNPEVKLVLRKIVNPVPMYARDTKKSGLRLPVAGKAVGFDLMEYDWMPPYGKGRHADFIFTLNETYKGEYNFDSALSITFLNKYDGIQIVKEDLRNGSMFKLPRFAPEDGYQSKLTKTFKQSPGKPFERDFDNGTSYIFRVRSEVKDNKLVRAMYGKIHGDIAFDPAFQKMIDLRFTYYLNPDYTRNLEYDRTRNLFGKLPSLEMVDQ